MCLQRILFVIKRISQGHCPHPVQRGLVFYKFFLSCLTPFSLVKAGVDPFCPLPWGVGQTMGSIAQPLSLVVDLYGSLWQWHLTRGHPIWESHLAKGGPFTVVSICQRHLTHDTRIRTSTLCSPTCQVIEIIIVATIVAERRRVISVADLEKDVLDGKVHVS